MGSSTNVNNTDPFTLWPEQGAPPIPVAGTVDAAAVYCDGTNLMLSVNGGAYAAIQAGAVVVTLNAAYGGGPAGNTILMTDALGAITFSSARTTGSILAITTTNAPGTVLGAITGIAIDMSSLGTVATPASVDLPAITIVGARSSVAKTRAAALVQISSAYRNATAVSVMLKNKQALAGSCVLVGWDAINYEGAAASSILTGQTHVVTIDGTTNVDAATNNPEFVNLRILTPDSSNASTRAILVTSFQTAGMVLQMTAGTQTLSGDLTGIEFAPVSVVGNNQNFFGLTIAGPVAVSTASWLGSFVWKSVPGTAAGNGIVNISTNMATSSGLVTYLKIGTDQPFSPGATVNGVNVNLSSFTPGAQYINGMTITIPASTRPQTDGEGALVIDANATQTPTVWINSRMQGAAVAGSPRAALNIFFPAGTTHLGVGFRIVGVGVAASNSLNAGDFYGVYSSVQLVTGAANSCSTNTSCFVGAFYGNRTDRGIFFAGTDGLTLTTAGTYLCYRAAFEAALTLGAGLDGAAYDLFSNVVANGLTVRGLQIYIASGASASSYAALFDYRNLAGTSAGNGIVNINTNISGTTTGVLTFLEIGSDTSTLTLAAATTGINCDLLTKITVSGARDIIGLNVTLPATTGGGTAGVLVTSVQTGAGSAGIRVSMAPGSGSAVVGVQLDMAANVTGAALSISHLGTGSNQNQLAFTSVVDGTGAHLRGPTTGQFVIKAGISAGVGRDVAVTASAAATSGAGGGFFVTTGAGNTNGNGGDNVFTTGALAGSGRRGYTYTVGAFAETSIVGGNTGTATITLACGDANSWTYTSTGVTTWVFSKPMDTAFIYAFVLTLTNGGANAQTWPASVKWPGGAAPALTAAGVDVLTFFTVDGGTTWRGALVQADSK